MSIEFQDGLEERIVSSTLSGMDENEVTLRPQTLSEYTGQEKAKENLTVCIEAASYVENQWITCCYTDLRGSAKPHLPA